MPRSRRLAVSLLTVGAVAAASWAASLATAATVPLDTHTSAARAFATGADMADDGTVVLAWWNFDTDAIHAATRVPGGSWTEQQIGAARSASDVDVAENDEGVFTVVWEGPTGLRTRQWSPGGGWQPIKQIATGTDITSPDVEAAPDGDVTVLWRTGTTALQTRTRTGSGWQPVTSLSTTRTASAASLVTDGAGRQTVVWSELRRDPGPGEDPDAVPRVPRMATRSTPTAAWGSPTWLEGADFDAGQPQITVGGDDVVTIAYAGRNTADSTPRTLVAKRFEPGGGSTQRVLERSNRLTSWIDLTATPDSARTYLVFTKEDAGGRNDLWSIHFEGETGTWSEPVARVTTGDVVRPEIGLGRRDLVSFKQPLAVMWTDYGNDHKTKYAIAPQGIHGWTAPSVLGSGGPSYQSSRGWLFDDQVNFVGYVVADQRLEVVPFDRRPPTTTMTRPAARFTTASSARFGWAAVDRWSPIASYDTLVRRVTPFDSTVVMGTGLSGTTQTTHDLALPDHTSTCYQARARDTVQPQPGRFSAERCVITPVDDALTEWSAGWTQVDQSGSYDGTVHRTKQQGRSMRLDDIDLQYWALLATKAPDNGTVEVFFDGAKVAERSLASPTVRKQVVVPLPTFGEARNGDVRVSVKTAGQRVQIDGIFLGRPIVSQ